MRGLTLIGRVSRCGLISNRRGKTKTQTQLGLGWRHQQQRTILMRKLIDGELCWWCGLALRKEPTKNWDGRPLAADHSQARALGGMLADRLLHFTCNSQRGYGNRDHKRPALTGVQVDCPDVQSDLAMDW